MPKSVLLFEVRLKMSNAYTYNDYNKRSGHFDCCLLVCPLTGDVTDLAHNYAALKPE